jgi:hypothetical protein
MPEYFCLSFLIEKKQKNINEAKSFFRKTLGITTNKGCVGKSGFSLLSHKQVVSYVVEMQEDNYFEFVIGIADHRFRQNTFDNQLKEISNFVNYCFEKQKDILYVLCGYEIDASWLDDRHDWKQIDSKMLNRIPIVFINKNIDLMGTQSKKLKHSTMIINHKAQDLFAIL